MLLSNIIIISGGLKSAYRQEQQTWQQL